MPNDSVSLVAPLYPNAVPTNQSPKVWFINRPGTPYEKTAVARFSVPVSAANAYRWYLRTLANCGYRRVDFGMTINKGRTARGMYFQGTTVSNENISVSVTKSWPNTSVLYYALAVSLPIRPVNSYVTGQPVRVTITYYLPDGKHFWRTSTVNQSEADTLSGAVTRNQQWGAPKLLDYVVSSCFSPENLGYAILTFILRSGHKQSFDVDYPCRQFWPAAHPKETIEDYDHSVWYAVTSIVYQTCSKHACKLHGG